MGFERELSIDTTQRVPLLYFLGGGEGGIHPVRHNQQWLCVIVASSIAYTYIPVIHLARERAISPQDVSLCHHPRAHRRLSDIKLPPKLSHCRSSPSG